MSRLRLTGGVALILVAAGSLAASAGDEPDSIASGGTPVSVAGVVGASKDIHDARIVGRSGKLYERHGKRPAVWRRRWAGGIAAAIRSAVLVEGGKLFAFAGRAPIYELDREVWAAAPLPNRGRVVVSVGGGIPAFAIGRHIYVREDGRWQRAVSSKHRVTAMWASGARRIYAATVRGELLRSDGKKWRPLANPLPDDDPIVALWGSPGNELYGRSRAGHWLQVSGRGATRVKVAGALSNFDVHTAAVGADGAPIFAGMTGPQRDRPVLAVARKGRLTVARELWRLPEGDRFAAVATDRSGGLLVVSRHGRVRLRRRKGGWVDATIDSGLPENAARVFEQSGPARTR